MYLILDQFSLHFQNLLEPQYPTPYEIISIIHRDSFLKNQPSGIFNFVNKFISQVYLLIYEQSFPRVCLELQVCLQPSVEDPVGYWFLYQNYIVLRVYGEDLNAYRFPNFLTRRIVSLEVLRQRVNSDFIQFSSKNHAASFKLLRIVGPFTVKSKYATKIIEEMLAFFNFEEDKSYQYDPCQIILNKRKKIKRGNYKHKGTLEMKELENKLIFSSKEGEDSYLEQT